MTNLFFVSKASSAWDFGSFCEPQKHLDNRRTAVSSITQHLSQQYMHHTQSNIYTRKPSVVCGVYAPTKATARATIKRQKKKKKKSTLKAGRRRGAPGAEGAGIVFSVLQFLSCSWIICIPASHFYSQTHLCKYVQLEIWVVLNLFPCTNLNSVMQYSDPQQTFQ